MTNEEAYNLISEMLEMSLLTPQEYEALKIAKEALEKQIPKKVEFIDDDHGGRLRCTACYATVKCYNQYAPHCPICGQRLDWSKHCDD